jgi:hypothetical protein
MHIGQGKREFREFEREVAHKRAKFKTRELIESLMNRVFRGEPAAYDLERQLLKE